MEREDAMGTLRLGVFASGRGSNFQSIHRAIVEDRLDAEVCLLLSNNEDAGALAYAETHGIPTAVIRRGSYPDRDAFLEDMRRSLRSRGVTFVALAGYMKKIPPEIIDLYRNRMVNIHPALLPSFGGKGMYGHHVHDAVIRSGCKVTGVTVHVVDEKYDHGAIVAQRPVPVEEGDSPDALAARVLRVEHSLYPEVLQWFAEERVVVDGLRTIIRPPNR